MIVRNVNEDILEKVDDNILGNIKEDILAISIKTS
jgi:hypothetical protein